MTRWLKGHGHNLKSVRWYVDQESEDTLDRTAFIEMQKAIFDGEVRTVVPLMYRGYCRSRFGVMRSRGTKNAALKWSGVRVYVNPQRA